jgi:hypothetical protein
MKEDSENKLPFDLHANYHLKADVITPGNNNRIN